MRIIFLCFSLAFSLSAFAQPSPLNRRAVVLSGLASASSKPIPARITGAALFLNYLDPSIGSNYVWVDEINGIRFTNQGTTIPSNSASGMYYDGTTGHFHKNSNSGIQIYPANASIWWAFTPLAISHTFDCILGNNSGNGNGFFCSTSPNNEMTYVPASSPISKAVANVYYNVAIVAGAGSAATYTNGVAANTMNYTATGATNLWGIGQDANSDNNCKMYLKFVLVCTNYAFTSTDISNLNYFAAHN